MANEKITDFFIGGLLTNAEIDFTPNGSNIKEIQEALKTASKKGTGNAGFPEFTAKSKDFILIIENKAEIEKQVKYDDESETTLATDKKSIINYAENGALSYANKILAQTSFKKIFAFGCSGNEKNHCIRPIYLDENGYELLPIVDNFENFSQDNIEKYYKEQILGETSSEILELEDILKNSIALNEDLRNYGQLDDKEKPLVVSAILLALTNKDFDIESLKGSKTNTDGDKIFTAIKDYMVQVQVTPDTKKTKVLNEFNIIKDRKILNDYNENLGKTPLRYFTEFLKNNVLDSVTVNSKEDVLGRFYGEFIRYSGGDGQTLGVVLTPSHITELFCDLVDVKPSDLVFDPCCGTSGFLIAALHKMILQVKTKEEEINIKKNQLHGIEIREDMFSIATTNMILRGDGKSNLENKDFLKQSKEELRKKNYTVGFMNPPYSQAKGEGASHLSEMHFIEHLLAGLADGARCVVIVPQSIMIGKNKSDKNIKKQILKKHTLEGVITLNKNTFYGVGTNTCLAVFTANKPHSKNKYCKFVDYNDDGFVVKKHVGLIETERAKERKKHLLDAWLHDVPVENKFMVKTTIEPDDVWLHPFYYFNEEVPKEADFEKTIADYLTFEFNMIIQKRQYVFGTEKDIEQLKKYSEIKPLKEKKWQTFRIGYIFSEIKRGKRLKKANHIKGNKPYISSTGINNGVDGFVGNKERVRIFSNSLTIANSGSVGSCFYQPFEFVASDHVHVAKLKNGNRSEYIYKFISTVISRLKTKYSFNYEMTDSRIERENILLPVNQKNEPDYEYMENYMKKLEYEKIKQYSQYCNIGYNQ